MAIELRPRGVGEIIDATFRIYRAHWWTLVKTVGILLLPIGIIQMMLQYQFTTFLSNPYNTFDTAPSNEMLTAMFTSWIIMLIPTLLHLLASALIDAAVVRETATIYLGGQPESTHAWSDVRQKWVSILGAAVLTYMFTIGAALVSCFCIFLGGLVIYVFMLPMIPLVMLEGMRATSAIQRSFNLVQNGFWRALGVLIVTFLIILIVNAGLQLVLTGGIMSLNFQDFTNPNPITSTPLYYALITLISICINIIIMPLLSICKTLVYYDLRIRREGFDLEQTIPSPAPSNPL